MRKSVIIIMAIIIAGVFSCTHDHITPAPATNTSSGGNGGGGANAGGGGTPAPAPSDVVCFQTEVLPLYQTYCASTGCHDGKSNGEDNNLNLTTYANIKAGIVAFNPGQSRYYTIIQNGSMPPGNSPKISSAQLTTIAKWINQGALNNSCATSTCDTTQTTYTNGISQIFATYCNGCHGVAPGSGNVVLSDYASAKSAGTSLKATFLSAINYTSTSSLMNMPPSGPLSSCQVKQISIWINSGCPQ